jgi:NADH-quinone oxidoreductase subunit C
VSQQDATPSEGEPEAVEPEPELVHGCPVSWSHGQRVVHSNRDGYLELVRALRRDGFSLCVDVTAVDYLAHPGRSLPSGIEAERFEVVVNLLQFETGSRLRVRVQVPAEDPSVPSLFSIWPGCDAPEREVFDMFGIRFEGHPDLTRILMPEDWEGYPLRKDYAVGRIPVQFKEAPAER